MGLNKAGCTSCLGRYLNNILLNLFKKQGIGFKEQIGALVSWLNFTVGDRETLYFRPAWESELKQYVSQPVQELWMQREERN